MIDIVKRHVWFLSITAMVLISLVSLVFAQTERVSPDVPFQAQVMHSEAEREADLTHWLTVLIETTDAVNLDWQKLREAEIQWVNRCELNHTELGTIQDYLKRATQSSEGINRDKVKKTDREVIKALKTTCNVKQLTDRFVY